MNQILYSENTDKKIGKKIAIGVLILLVILVAVFFILTKRVENKVLANVYLGDVNVGLQTKEDATNTLSEVLGEIQSGDLKLSLNGKSVVINKDLINLAREKDFSEMIDEAYNHGRSGDDFFANGFEAVKSFFTNKVFDVGYVYDEEKLEEALNELISGDDEFAIDDSYTVSGDLVTITRGSKGVKIDLDDVKSKVIASLISGDSELAVPTVERESAKVDLDKLYAKVYVAPVDASIISGDKFEISKEQNGKMLDIDELAKLYDNLEEGKSITVSLKELPASVKVKDLEDQLFNDVLAEFKTNYDEEDVDRTNNLIIACNKTNDMILNPGDVYSFNKTLGTISASNGYTLGGGYAGGRIVKTIGGGVCQVSSTLYNAALLANLKIVERGNHGMTVPYVEPGFDAVFSASGIDFKFSNNRNYPIKLKAEAKDGEVKVSILGMREPSDKIVELESVVLETIKYKTIRENDSSLAKGETKVSQEGLDGSVAESYIILKEKDGTVVSKTLISKDRYNPINEIIKVGTKGTTSTTTNNSTSTNTQNTEKTNSNETTNNVIIDGGSTSHKSEDPSVVVYDNEEGGDDNLPSGWDSPESPYGNN